MLIVEATQLFSPGAIFHRWKHDFDRDFPKVKKDFFHYKFFLPLAGGFESFNVLQNVCTTYSPEI